MEQRIVHTDNNIKSHRECMIVRAKVCMFKTDIYMILSSLFLF